MSKQHAIESDYGDDVKLSPEISSIWSTSDASVVCADNNGCSISPLVYKDKLIRYNIEDGVNYKTPILFGSKKVTGSKGESGYRSTQLLFDPQYGSLLAGHNLIRQIRLPYFSLLTGFDNSASLNGSLISGSHNHINLIPFSEELFRHTPPGCTIIGGSHNIIENDSLEHEASAIIGSKNVRLHNCDETVVLGLKATDKDGSFNNLREATITRNLYGLNQIVAGPLNSPIPTKTVLAANGDAFFRNDVKVQGTVDTKTLSATNLFVENATASNLTVSGATRIVQNSLYLEGTGGNTGSTFFLGPNDAVDIIYANPINGTVNIILSKAHATTSFFANQLLTVKDVTLEFVSAAAHNVNIWTKPPVKIEHYDSGLTAGVEGPYVLNTSGGSVSLRFARFPKSAGTWIIQDQFQGNPRLFSQSGFIFIPADEPTKAKLLNSH